MAKHMHADDSRRVLRAAGSTRRRRPDPEGQRRARHTMSKHPREEDAPRSEAPISSHTRGVVPLHPEDVREGTCPPLSICRSAATHDADGPAPAPDAEATY